MSSSQITPLLTPPPVLKRPRKGAIKATEFAHIEGSPLFLEFVRMFPPAGAHVVNGILYLQKTHFMDLLGVPPSSLRRTLTTLANVRELPARYEHKRTAEELVDAWLSSERLQTSEILALWYDCHNRHRVVHADVEKIVHSFTEFYKEPIES
jgi:hypothetical protein